MKTFLEYVTKHHVSSHFDLMADKGEEKDIVIHTNPGHEELRTALEKSKYKNLRGMIDHKNNVHVWDASDAIHRDIGRTLKIPKDYGMHDFYVRNEHGIRIRPNNEAHDYEDHPKLKRMFGNKSYKVEYGTPDDDLVASDLKNQ